MSCGSHNSDRPLGMMSQWFLQHCPQLNGPELCIDASHSCAESCTWGTGTHMLSLDHAPSLCVRTALISCLVPPHSIRLKKDRETQHPLQHTRLGGRCTLILLP